MKRVIFCFDGTWNNLVPHVGTTVVLRAASVPSVCRNGRSTAIRLFNPPRRSFESCLRGMSALLRDRKVDIRAGKNQAPPIGPSVVCGLRLTDTVPLHPLPGASAVETPRRAHAHWRMMRCPAEAYP